MFSIKVVPTFAKRLNTERTICRKRCSKLGYYITAALQVKFSFFFFIIQNLKLHEPSVNFAQIISQQLIFHLIIIILLSIRRKLLHLLIFTLHPLLSFMIFSVLRAYNILHVEYSPLDATIICFSTLRYVSSIVTNISNSLFCRCPSFTLHPIKCVVQAAGGKNDYLCRRQTGVLGHCRVCEVMQGEQQRNWRGLSSQGRTNKIPRRYLPVQPARVHWNFSNKIEAFGGTDSPAREWSAKLSKSEHKQ